MRERREKPNIIICLCDQLHGQALGCAGDTNAITPNIDKFARESIYFTNAVAGIPVCTPSRACLITGKYPLTHGVFLNDVYLQQDPNSIARIFSRAGYSTAYIGKWHLDGHGSRSLYIPRERRQGFDYWKALECTHDYFNSFYYADDDPSIRKWNGYDAIAQSKDACQFIEHAVQECKKPFFLILSWGPPHNPYNNAPVEFKRKFKPRRIELRPNVPKKFHKRARKDLSGYYSHVAALDYCFSMINNTIKKCNIKDDTILIFTSDHGDMLYSHGEIRKQRPWDESIIVPLIIRYPRVLGRSKSVVNIPINTPDVMPTLLGLCNLPIPETVQGRDFSKILKGQEPMPPDNPVLITCPAPFGEFQRIRHGGREYRGVRTSRYTYVRDLTGSWLLYDNLNDPYQRENLLGKTEGRMLEKELHDTLSFLLDRTDDAFHPADYYIKKWGYKVDKFGTVPYRE
ncbi:MAG: sulfatase family protein [Promethearchaeota archaeon]